MNKSIDSFHWENPNKKAQKWGWIYKDVDKDMTETSITASFPNDGYTLDANN